MENINKEEPKIIKESSNKITSEELKVRLVTNKLIDLEFKKREVKEILKKFYVIHKYKMNKNYCFSEAYYDLEDFIGNIKYDSYNFPSPPPIKPEVNDNKHSIQLLQELKSLGEIKNWYQF